MRFNPFNLFWRRLYEKMKDNLLENGYTITNGDGPVKHTLVRNGDEYISPNDPELSHRLLLRPRVFGGYLSGESTPDGYPTLDRRYRELSLNGILHDRPAGVVLYNPMDKMAAVLMRA